MKPLYKTLLLLAFITITATVFAQNSGKVQELVSQGFALHDQQKYDEAIAKYKEALTIDPENYKANYETAYTLLAQRKLADAIPYLEAALKSDPKSAEAYTMIGNIYDDLKQPDKALDYYKKGIDAAPDYQRLHYNIAFTYLAQKQYTNAEKEALTAIQLEPKHSSSYLVFGMVNNVQGKTGAALLGFCNFLLLEPQSKRSGTALNYIKAIINQGITNVDEKNVKVSINANDMSAGKLIMPLAIINATSGKTGLSATDSLTLQLTKLFEISHNIADDRDYPTVAKHFSDFFQSLAKSGNMPAFTRYISLSAYKEENLAWFKEHDKELTAFSDWIKATKREF